jgi:hypothetical protein
MIKSVDASEGGQHMRAAEQRARITVWLSRGSGAWNCQSVSALHHDTGHFGALRIILVIVVSKESRQEGLGKKSNFCISNLGSNVFCDSLNKLPFLLQRLLKKQA